MPTRDDLARAIGCVTCAVIGGLLIGYAWQAIQPEVFAAGGAFLIAAAVAATSKGEHHEQ